MDNTIYNNLLNYQFREHFEELGRVPTRFKAILKGISDAYDCYEREARLTDLSPNLLSDKMVKLDNKLDKKDDTELIFAEKELYFQFKEKEKRADELAIANIELAFQNEEKEKRAAELIVANKELVFQNEEKEKRADELAIANIELAFQNKEKEKRASELIVANKELVFQNEEKEKRAAELIVANKELAYQNDEKEKRANELTIANSELAFQNKEKEKRAAELIVANKELVFQNEEKGKRAAELTLANKNLKKAEENNRKLNEELEQKVTERTEQLQSANKELESFSYSVSHALRTPLMQLVVNESLLARAEQVAQLGSWELNFTDNVLRLSAEGSRIFGFSAGQNKLSFEEWSLLVHPDDLENVLQTIKASQETLTDTAYHHRIVLGDGTIRHINSESKFEFDSSGKSIGLYGTMQDVTEKINAEQLREFEKRDKEALINSTDDVMWSVSRDFKLVAANKAFIQSYSAAVGITLQRDDYLLNPDLYPPEFLILWKSFYERALKGEIFKEEVHIPAFSSATETWLETGFNPIYREDTVVGIACYSRNIAERKLAEKLIREAEAKYRTFFETSMDGILLADTTGKIFTANPAACSIFLMTEAEICKAGREGIIDVTDPRLKPFLQERSLTGMAKGELILIRKDGTRFSSEITSSIYPDIHGHEKASIIIRDITDRKKTEEEIHAQIEIEGRIRKVLTQSLKEISDYKYALDRSSIVAITDPKGIINHVNENFCKISKYSSEELIGQDHRIINSGYHPKEFIRNLWVSIANGKVWKGELNNKAKDGTYYWVDTTIVPFLNEKGKPYQYTVIRTDITARKKAELAIKDSEKRYRQIVETAQEGIWMVDENNKTNFVNKRLCEILGYSPEEMMGKEIFDFMDAEAKMVAVESMERRKQGHNEALDFKYITKEGAVVWTHLATNPVLDNDGKYIGALAMVTDITQRKLDEESLKRSEANLEIKNKELEIKNKELEQFAYVASHDLQEPLRTTSSFIELFQQQYQGKLDERADKYFTYIAQASERMKVFITDLLEYSRIGSQKQLQQVDCNILLKEVLADLDTAIHETGAEIKNDTLPVIRGYQIEIKQLIQNLVFNAIKFRRKNVSPRIKISAHREGDSWQFAFTDNGIGIAKEHNERIFIIFQRLHNRNEYAGSGIGLSHCKKIVELHKGKIWLESELGKGTTFYFTIPQNNN